MEVLPSILGESLDPLADFAKIALDVHMMGNSNAQAQAGREGLLKKWDGWFFDLVYARQEEVVKDFCAASREVSERHFNPLWERNALASSKLNNTQNEILKRFCIADDEAKDLLFPFEESAAAPLMTATHLLTSLQSQLSLLSKAEVQAYIDRYLFKISIDAQGIEAFPLADELNHYPRVFTDVLKGFLHATNFLQGEHEEGVLNFALRLYALSGELPCPILREELDRYFKERELKWYLRLERIRPDLNQKEYVMLHVYLLKSLQEQIKVKIPLITDDEWHHYFSLGSELQETLSQHPKPFNPIQKQWWGAYRCEMAEAFRELREKAPERAATIRDPSAGFDLLELTINAGTQERIPLEILNHPEFKRLFGDRVLTWKKGPGGFKFTDKASGEFFYDASRHFPEGLCRKVENWKYHYVPYERVQGIFNAPETFIHEGSWWLKWNGSECICFHLNEPSKVWVKSNDQGLLKFEEGPLKNTCLERMTNKTQSLLPEQIGPAGMSYISFKPRKILGISQFEFRDALVFPNIKTDDGKGLIFEAVETPSSLWAQKGFPTRYLKSTIFSTTYSESYSRKEKKTPLKVYGIIIGEQNNIASDSGKHNSSILLPFQKHTSEVNAHTVKSLQIPVGKETGPLLNSIEMISIDITHGEFNPKKPVESLFSSYLSLVGKDYSAALRYLKKVRSNHRLDENERTVLRWMIDSSEDAHDHSSTAAAIKLRAYKLLVEQGSYPGKPLLSKDLPETTLETLYLNYLNHLSSVPVRYHFNGEDEMWLFNKGFVKVPPQEANRELWEARKEEIQGALMKASVKILPETPTRRQPLLQQWNHVIVEQMGPFEIQEALAEGIAQGSSKEIIPGKKYPQELFGEHYRQLTQELLSSQQKWELIYQIETSLIPNHLKAILQYGYEKGRAASPLPNLTIEPRYNWKQSCKRWMETILSSIPIQEAPHPLERVDQARPDRLQNATASGNTEANQAFNRRLQELLTSDFQISAKDLLAAFRKAFVPTASTGTFVMPQSAPFSILLEDQDLFFKDRCDYASEWQKGKEALAQKKMYPPLSRTQLTSFTTFLDHFQYISLLGDQKLEIQRQLNRYPVDKGPHIESVLQEMRGGKEQMDMEEAFRFVLLPTPAEKLRYLQKRNPFLIESDVTILTQQLKDYFALSILRREVLQFHKKIKSILQRNDLDDATSLTDPAFIELGQEIGEAFNPYEEDPADEQAYMEKLLFEHISGFRMREEQATILHTLIHEMFSENPDDRAFAIVFQLMMGGGKTSVILAHLAKLAAQQNQVPLFLAHHSQYASVKANLIGAQFTKFRQDVTDLDFSREELASVPVLKFINEQLIAAKDKKRMLLMKTSFIQMLQLEFVDQLQALRDPQNLDPSTSLRILELAQALQFMKDNCLLICDEADINFDILQEMNFASGSSAIIKQESFDLIKQIYLILATDPEIAPLLKLQNEHGMQSLVTPEKVQEIVIPQLVNQLLEEFPSLSLLIPATNYQSFEESLKAYLMGKIDERLGLGLNAADEEAFLDSLDLADVNKRAEAQQHLLFLKQLQAYKKNQEHGVKEALNAIALSKELCVEILPLALSKAFNKNYGFTEEGKVIRYLGVGEPADTEFGNIYEATAYFFQAALNRGVTLSLINTYRDNLKEASLYYAELYKTSPEDTAEAKHFEMLTGLPLHQAWSEQSITSAL